MKQSTLFAMLMVILGTSALVPVKAQEDLVYVAVEPCRIADTRTTQGGTGALAAGEERAFRVYGDLSSQGGNICDHPRNDPDTGVEPLAASVYLVAVGGGIKTRGFLTAFPADTTPGSVASLNYDKNQIIGNTTIVTLCQSESCLTTGQLGLTSSDSQNVVMDIQGYFYPQRQVSAIRYLFGLAVYDARCAGCHDAGTHDSDGGFAGDIAGTGSLLVNDLGTLSGAMSGIILTDQEILDLQAFLDDPSIQPPQ